MNASDMLPSVSRLDRFFSCFGAAVLVGALLAAPGLGQESELDRARQLHLQGERTTALEHYQAFLAAADAAPADLATAHNNTCVLLHELGEVAPALRACRQALELRRRLGDQRPLARTLNNLGLVLQSSGHYPEARQAYLEALDNNRRRADVAAEAINLANLGWLASSQGRYGLALERHLEVEALAARHAGEPWAEDQRRVAWINRGVVLEKLGAYHQALELFQRLVGEREALGPRRWATVLINLGTVYRNLGDPHMAVDAYRRAAEIFEQEDDRAALSNARLNLGQVLHRNLGRLAEAEQALLEALRLARDSGDRGEEIQDLILLGDLQLDRGDAAGAAASFERSLELAVESGSAEGEWTARFGLGRLAAAAGAPDLALEHLGAAIEVIERTRSAVADRGLRGGFFASWRQVYEHAVEVRWQRQEAADAVAAFSLVQRAKQRELVDAMGGPAAVMMGGASIGGELEELRAALGDAALVEYFFTSGSLLAWRLDAGGLRWWRLEAAAELGALAASVHARLAAREPPSEGDPERLAGLLRDAGLVAGQSGGAAAERLIVAPDGPLRHLPFELLPLGGESGELMVDRFEISYLPAASALLRPQDREARRFTLVALADPAPAGDRESRAARDLLGQRFTLERLPSSRREIEAAAGQLPGERLLLVDHEATTEALGAAVAGGTHVLHLGVHTVIDERPGGQAAVLLAPGGPGSPGILGPQELARLDLRADLTVLAACQTALGEPGRGGRQGGGFGSLTGAFLAAGSRAVLATLVDVEDASTEVFMQQLYHHLGTGLDPSRALTATKRRLRRDARWQAPHLWAPYVLVGDAPPIVPRPRPWRLAAGISAASLALIVAWLVAGRRRFKES